MSYNKQYFENTERGRKTMKNGRQVVEMLASGMTYKEIAQKLNVHITTVKTREGDWRRIQKILSKDTVLPECPICRKFHEHNHGGLDVTYS